MMRNRLYAATVAIILIGFLCACASFGSGTGADGEGISALGAIGGLADSGPMYEGNGGAGIRIAVLTPDAQGEVPSYLPLYIQGLLNNNFKKYSAVTLIDRQNLDKIMSEQDITLLGGRFSDEDYVAIGKLTNAQYFLIGTIQKLSGNQYSLQLSLTNSSTGERKASFMKNGMLAQFEGSGALINEAASELLVAIGVRLTEAGKRSLLAGSMVAARAESSLARGITAQASGAEVEALLNYSQSAAFDPSGMEALARLGQLSASISGGTISERILNDIQARDRWLAVFKETATFFDGHPPFEFSFDPNLMQEGETDYIRRTVNLAMRVSLEPSEAGFAALNALLEGLEKTGRRGAWGFAGWPLLDIPRTVGTVVFGGKRSCDFKVDIALLNEQGKTLSRSNVTLKSGALPFNAGDRVVVPPPLVLDTVCFANVKAIDLTPVLTIQITGVNGIPSSRLNRTGYMRIATVDLEMLIRQREEKIQQVKAVVWNQQDKEPKNMADELAKIFKSIAFEGYDPLEDIQRYFFIPVSYDDYHIINLINKEAGDFGRVKAYDTDSGLIKAREAGYQINYGVTVYRDNSRTVARDTVLAIK